MSNSTRVYESRTYNVVEVSPILRSTAKKGNDKFWQMYVLGLNDAVFTQTEYWSTTNDGSESERIASTPKEIKGKNIGKSNETSPLEQAKSELVSMVKKQKDKGYVEEGEESKNLLLPMLAHEFGKRKKALSFPCLAQPKLDGVRALFNRSIGFWSRQGKLFIPETVSHLVFETNDLIFDGELILPPPYTFQQTVSAVKKYDPILSPLLEYWVYDVVDDSMDFVSRKMTIETYLSGDSISEGVKRVPTIIISEESFLPDAHSKNIEGGFEGTMLRNLKGAYLVGHRSENLLKLKDFVDDEFEIVDVIDGVAKEQGCAIFICKTADGKTFNVRPKGTVEQRQEMFNRKSELIGSFVTVRYQNLSDEGVPRFPVGITLRDYE